MKKRFSKKDRQEIINDYLNKTGRNIIVPAEFRQWLSTQPDHPMYKVLEWDEEKRRYNGRERFICKHTS